MVGRALGGTCCLRAMVGWWWMRLVCSFLFIFHRLRSDATVVAVWESRVCSRRISLGSSALGDAPPPSFPRPL